MKFFTKLKKASRKLVVAGAVVAAVAGFAAFSSGASADVTLSTATDCDMNAVIYCGATSTSKLISSYDNGNSHNSAGSIHDIYNYFGISSSEVKSMNTTAVAGKVMKNGDVYVGSELVATNALTAGRENISGSTHVTYSGTSFYTRKPSVSFRSSSLSAYVVMVNGKFSFAIIGSCGNPVKATPKSPSYNVTKEVRVKGTSTYSKSVSVLSGTHVQYRITVNSSGAVPAVNVVTKDTLPANVTYVDNTLALNGAAVSSDSAFFSTGNKISSLAPGKSAVYTFEAIIGAKDTTESCTPETLNNTGTISSPGLPTGSSSAGVNKTCAPKPVYSCDNLNQNQVSRDNYTFTATATAKNGAVITSYVFDFGDSNKQTVTTSAATASAPHTYAKPGTYNANVTVNMTVNGKAVQVTGPNCKTTVTVAQPPTAECTDLKLTLGEDRTVSATVTTSTLPTGVSVKNIAYTFGDNTAVVNTTDKTVTHTYAADGNYTVKAIVSFTAPEGDTIADSPCQASIGINSPAYSCDLLHGTAGDNRTVTIDQFNTTATGGATFKSVVLDWGDGSKTADLPTALNQTHSYAADGTYNITATASFTVNGQTVVAPIGNCKTSVPFTTTTVCAVNPNLPANSPDCQVCQFNSNLPANSSDCTPPTTLVNTGAGNIFALFGATTIVGVIAHRLFLARKLSRQ